MDCAKFKLKEISYHITDGEHCSVQNSEDGGFYLLSNKNIIDGNIVFGEDERKISKETFDKINKRTKLSKGDLVISTVGTLGKLSIIKEIPNYDFQRSVGIIKPNCSVVDVEYLYYYMQQSHVQKKLTCGSSGAIQKCIFINQLKDFEVQLPSLSIQHRLASALSSFDKRIENLRAQNRVLEQTAKTIYDYTFLQCAGHQTTYNKTLNRNIPAEWEIDNLYRIADFTNGLACQKYRPITEKEKLPVIKIREMHDGVTADTEFVRSDIPEKVIVNPGDLLFSWSASLEVMMWNGVKGGLNQHIFKVTPKEYFSLYFVYFQLKDYIGNFKRMAEARKTTMGHITTDHLNQSRIAIPDEETMKRFSSLVTPLFKKQLVNSQQIETLTTQRNTLLPLLMTGQVEVM